VHLESSELRIFGEFRIFKEVKIFREFEINISRVEIFQSLHFSFDNDNDDNDDHDHDNNDDDGWLPSLGGKPKARSRDVAQ
jgi:hypothetical protein